MGVNSWLVHTELGRRKYKQGALRHYANQTISSCPLKSLWACLAQCLNRFLNVKALTFNLEKGSSFLCDYEIFANLRFQLYRLLRASKVSMTAPASATWSTNTTKNCSHSNSFISHPQWRVRNVSKELGALTRQRICFTKFLNMFVQNSAVWGQDKLCKHKFEFYFIEIFCWTSIKHQRIFLSN